MSLAHMIFNAMVIGALGSLPVGPIVVMTFQKSLCYGRKAGMACASGAMASDTVFAAMALFAYSLISNLLLEYSKQIEIIGGLVIVIMGVAMWIKKHKQLSEAQGFSSILYDTGKSMLMGFSNPGSFFWVLAAFAASGFEAGSLTALESAIIVLSVALGSFIYWYAFTWFVAKGRNRLKEDTILKISNISAIAIILFGIFFLCKGIFGK